MQTINSILPWVCCVIIAFVCGLFFKQAQKIHGIYTTIQKLDKTSDLLEQLKNNHYSDLVKRYKESINISTDNGMKTNIPASEYFNDLNICFSHQVNLRMLDTASGTLVGLGLLGTFLGLTLGVLGFDSEDTAQIQQSIQSLLSGMGTAFSTSLVGMIGSLIYTAYDKKWRNRLTKNVNTLCDELDAKYYIDDITLAKKNQKDLLDELYKNIRGIVERQSVAIVSEFNGKLTYKNEEGHIVPVANAVREMLTENKEQSKALKSFSTDLAIELNNGFDETLSRQMQQKILPLMESVDATTKSVIEHIDTMAASVASPATDMIQTVVDQLRTSMEGIMREFSTGLSGSATNELEELASQLGTATQAMAEFPSNMENISKTLQVTIEEVKSAISEISNTSANANSTAMQQMQEQIAFATGAISNAIAEVKDVMSSITQSSQEQSNQMVSKLADAAEKMGTFLTGTVSSLSSSVQESVKGITDDVNAKQADLIALQEDTTIQTKKLLDAFNQGLDRLERINSYVTGTMDMFQKAQGQITGSTAHLQVITSDMKTATEVFNKTQKEHNCKIEEIQHNNQRNIDAVANLLRESGELSKDYADKFEIIREGLSDIFGQLQSGLSEYSRTVQATTQKYLDQYSTSLTNTTEALSSTIQQQNEVVETLVEALNRKR